MSDSFARFLGDLEGQVFDPMTVRLLLQPLIGTYSAIRDRMDDRPNSFEAGQSTTDKQGGCTLHEWKAVIKLLSVAVAVDMGYQAVILQTFYLDEAVVAAFALACLPYFLTRSIAGRVAPLLARRATAFRKTAAMRTERAGAAVRKNL